MLQLFGYDMKQNGSGRSNTNTKPAYVWALCRTLRRRNWDLGICRLKYWGWVGLVGLMESHAMEWGSEFWRLGQVSMDLGSCVMWNLTKLVASTIFYMPFICPSWVPAKIGAHFRWEPILGRFLFGLPGCPVGFHHPLRFAGPGPLQPVLEVQGGGGQTLEQLLPTRFLQCLIYSPVEWG